MGEFNGPAPWPSCPQCAEPRKTICPFCAVAGSGFPQGDREFAPDERAPDARAMDPELPAQDDEHLLLLCPTCDEPFQPTFYRFCENCGEDFGTGLELPGGGVEGETQPLTGRAVWVFVGLVSVGLVISLYFAWVLATN